MKAVCAWCKRDMGEKDPLGDESVTHSICPSCAMQLKTPVVALLERIEAHLQNLAEASGKPVSPWMDARQVAEYTGFAPKTISKLASLKVIPHYRPAGTKSVRFKQEEIDAWMGSYKSKGRTTYKLDKLTGVVSSKKRKA